MRNRIVFIVSLLLTSTFILFGLFFNETLQEGANRFLNTTINWFGWFYLSAALFFVLFSIYLAFSKYGAIRLGEDDEKPTYRYPTWFAMLFSAGMGIGLLFWGVAEPVLHYLGPPFGEGSTPTSADIAMRYAFFHWGIQPWAIYTVIALSLAYFQFRKKKPALISSVFYPVLGERVQGPIGKIIDILAVFATVFGVATSLGLGTMQINGGLNFLWGLPNNNIVQIGIIAIVTVLFMISAWTGLNKGIKYLSNVNLSLALVILLFLLILGPTAHIFKVLINTTGSYLNNYLTMSLRLEPFREESWIATWTLFYWAWWIAWAPFVGSFIARVSKGRTIKEFVIGVLIVPTSGTFFWFSTLGGSALNVIHDQGNTALAQAVSNDETRALFDFYTFFPLTFVVSFLTVALIITFFVTSADSATFVLGMLSEEGSLTPTKRTKLTWGVIIASVSMVLLLSNSLETLQTVSIGAAFPFAIVMLFMCYSFLHGLKMEENVKRKKKFRSEKSSRQ